METVQGERRFAWDQGKTSEELKAKEAAREARKFEAAAPPQGALMRQPMGFGKVVLAVLVGNLLTGGVAWFLWLIVK